MGLGFGELGDGVSDFENARRLGLGLHLFSSYRSGDLTRVRVRVRVGVRIRVRVRVRVRVGVRIRVRVRVRVRQLGVQASGEAWAHTHWVCLMIRRGLSFGSGVGSHVRLGVRSHVRSGVGTGVELGRRARA